MDTLELLNEVLLEKRARGVSEQGRKEFASGIRRFAPLAPTTDDYTADTAEDIYEWLSTQDWSISYQGRYCLWIREIVKAAIERGLVPERTLKLFSRIKVPSPPMPACTPEEFEKLFATAGTRQFKTALLLGYDAGLRSHEAAGVTVDDVDLERMVIRLGKRKGGNGQYIPILTNRLQAWLPHAVEFAPRHRHIALSENAKIRQLETFRYHMRRLCERAGTRPIKFHDLRRGFATWSLRDGLDGQGAAPWAIHLAMGHTNIEMTMHYIENMEVRADAIRKGYGNGGRPPIDNRGIRGVRPWTSPLGRRRAARAV